MSADLLAAAIVLITFSMAVTAVANLIEVIRG